MMVGPNRPQIVLFGSSIVQMSYSHAGWGSILSDIYSRKADIILRGYYGWNSRRAIEVLDEIFPKDAVVQPSLVIVYFGGNDSMGPHSSGLGPHVPLPEYVENMRKIAIHLKIFLTKTSTYTEVRDPLFYQEIIATRILTLLPNDQSLSDTTRIIFLSSPPLNEVHLRENQSAALSALVRTNELCREYSEACINLCHEVGVKVVDLWTAIQQKDDWLTACFTDGVHLSAEGSKIVVQEILKVLKEADWTPSLHWKSMPTEFAGKSPYNLVAADGKSTLDPSDWTFYREIKWD